MSTLFISDLHLCGQRPEITRLFLAFLKEEAAKAEALYILGDLFEYWIGDDCTQDAQFQPAVEGLRQLTASGVPTYFMHGNRDFLVGADFERASGCRLLHDPTVIDLHGRPTLLMHGDTLCTDDVEYQQFRVQVRNPDKIAAFLALSYPQRVAIATQLREMSKYSMSEKKAEIMDVNENAVRAAMREHGIDTLIHGHTHRPAVHTFDIEGRQAQRIVLGDWYDQGSVLRCDARGCRLENLPA